MGLKAACAYFQRVMMTQVLLGLLRRIVECYLDDLIVFGNTEESFLANLEELFQRLLASNVTLNPKKCRLGMEEIEYVGHTINSTGTHFSREKLSSVQEFKIPSTHRDLKSFLGLTNFFRDHIRNYADITAPLNKLVNGVATEKTEKGYRPNKPIDWTSVPGSLEALENIKKAVRDCPSLFFYDSVSPVILMTDASEIGYAAYLFQKVEKLLDSVLTTSDQIIQIYSKCWTGGQVNWSVPEKECYAIFNTLKLWEYLLKDIHFTIMTDHKNLVYINDSGAPKVKRWKLLIQEYNFDIVHVPGKYNTVADLLSRLCLLFEALLEEDEEEQEVFSINFKLMEECDADETWTELPVGQCYVMPVCTISEVSLPQEIYDELKAVHNSIAGHSGVKRTLEKLRKRGSSLNGMPVQKRQLAVKQFIQECAFCQKSDYRSVKIVTKPYTLAHTNRVMNYMSMDTVGPFPADTDGYRYILVLTCTFSRFTMLFPLKTLTALEAAHALLFHIGIFGAPAEIASDGGSQLVNETIDEMLRLT